MRCPKARDFVSQEMDEHLPPDVTVDLVTHLDSCADCREYREDLLTGRRAMASTTPELPDNFEWKLQLRLNQALQQAAGETAYPWAETDQDKWRWFRNFGAAAAVGMAAVLALAMFVGPIGNSEDPGLTPGRATTTGIAGTELGGAGGPDRLPLVSVPSRRGGLYDSGIQRSVSGGGLTTTSGGLFDRGWSGHDINDLRTIQYLRVENNQLNLRLMQQQRMIHGLSARLDTIDTNALDLEQE